MYPQPIVHKALSWGVIRKSACIFAEITIRKSQRCALAIRFRAGFRKEPRENA
jgi:hypothetical protein